MGQPLAHIVFGRVERTSERMVREIDAVALGIEHPGKKRRDVLAHGTFGQRPGSEGRRQIGRRRSRRRHDFATGPMSVRTSISSGKNA